MKKKVELIKEKACELLGKDEVIAFGVDQGYANLGISIIKYNILTEDIQILMVKGFKTLASQPLNKRISIINLFFKDIMDSELGKQVDVIGCERLFYNTPMKISDPKTAMMFRNKSASIMKTNMVTGILYSVTGELDKPIFEYAPTTIKKQITGNGRASKDELISSLNTIINKCEVEVKTNHETDAIGIAIATAKDYCEKIYKGE